MKKTILSLAILFLSLGLLAQDLSTQYLQNTRFTITLKKPGNPAVAQEFHPDESGKLTLNENFPLQLKISTSSHDQSLKIQLEIEAKEDVYFNLSGKTLLEKLEYERSQILMPGFWYRKNLRSPVNAPSARVSTDWLAREDRLSTPLSSVYDPELKTGYSLTRMDDIVNLSLTTHTHGEVVLSGKSDLGALGFGQEDEVPYLAFAFPYAEAPYSYIRKLTLGKPVTAFAFLKKGEKQVLNYEWKQLSQPDFSEFVAAIWHDSYESMDPQVIENQKFSDFEIKSILTEYFKSSFIDMGELKGFSGAHLETETAKSQPILEVGFIGRVLLNAFNALEFGEANKDQDLVDMAYEIFGSYGQNGFNEEGLIREYIDFGKGEEPDVYSIRRQSEGIYAILLFLKYEKDKGRSQPQLENKVVTLLSNLLSLQMEDGSFPRKFKSDLSLVDRTGGSSPSAVLPLVMAYQYFKKKDYLDAARRVAIYQEKEIIGPSDYFSSTLDADCEDKEASLYAATAMYYLSQVTNGKERDHYRSLAKKAAYFTLSWYYTWDVPFARGQMLGDIGLKSRGWGNVSVENNHIDVFIFEFDEVMDWLALETNQPEFAAFAKVIRSSMREQLLPHPDNMMGIGKVGFYPEVVQHTAWDYGKNGKGFYNDIFAPGWTVASIWELLTIGRTAGYFKK